MAAAHDPKRAQVGADEPGGRAAPARRKSAEERREEILAVALEHFANGGYRATSTEVIAHEAGISQPYLFRLFRTKKELFLACNERACDKVIDAFRRAAAAAPEGEKLKAMGKAYFAELVPDRHAILMMMQGFVATSDPEIQERVRSRFGDVVREVTRQAGVSPQEVWAFVANGMLLNVLVAIDLEAIADEDEWAAAWTQRPEEMMGEY
jgi:AcrR family transcriptional regulator